MNASSYAKYNKSIDIDVIDIREQYPLFPVIETEEIVDKLIFTFITKKDSRSNGILSIQKLSIWLDIE